MVVDREDLLFNVPDKPFLMGGRFLALVSIMRQLEIVDRDWRHKAYATARAYELIVRALGM